MHFFILQSYLKRGFLFESLPLTKKLQKIITIDFFKNLLKQINFLVGLILNIASLYFKLARDTQKFLCLLTNPLFFSLGF